ncbi:MAG: UDP-2,3-diacylglucosamine diphosphatase LpxI [Sneathiella sp.]
MVSVSQKNKGHSPRVGIIAGGGKLPLNLANSLKSKGQDPFLLLIKGEADPKDYSDFPFVEYAITKVGKFLKTLAAEKCELVTLVGPVTRPDFKNIIPDFEGLKLLARITTAPKKGDDGLLRAISEYIEEKGFHIVGAHELNADLLPDTGTLGDVEPSADDLIDIEEGTHIINAIGSLDIGQAVVVRDKYVLGVEAAEGTDGLVKRCGDFAREKPAGVLVKLSKPGQDLRTDMPTIGLETIRHLSQSNIKGVAIEAGACLLLNRAETIKTANQLGLFIYGVSKKTHKDLT